MVESADSPTPSNDAAKPDPRIEEDATRYIDARSIGSQQAGKQLRASGGRAAHGAPRHLEPGQLLAHTYEIETLLGRGGMGEVYRARHTKLQSIHAIKVIAPELVNDARAIEMFTEEARKLRMVRHDAVVSYDGLIGDEDGFLYLIMEFVDGVSLAKVIRERPLSADELRTLRDRLSAGLSAAHDKLIYHRDISPDNIILVNGVIGQAKIIDFGIAKSGATGDRTIIGNDFAGKFSYVSPEQLGMFGGQVDGRSDIYSLGLVLAAAGLGRALDMGNSPATAVEARRRLPDLSSLPVDLRAEIEPLLEPDPADRPASMRHLPGSGVSPTPGPRLSTPPPAQALARTSHAQNAPHDPLASRRRSTFPIIVASVAALTLVAGGATYLFWPVTARHTATPVRSSPVAPLASPPRTEAHAPSALKSAPARSATAAAAGSVATSSPPSAPPVEKLAVQTAPPKINARSMATRLISFERNLGCADLKPDFANSSLATVTGFVTSTEARSRLIHMLQGIPHLDYDANTITVRRWPQCDQAIEILRDAGAFASRRAAPRLTFNVASLDYHLGDKLVLHILASTTFNGFLYVDFMDSKGNIVHLLPRPNGPSNAVRAGQTITLGAAKDSVLEIAKPLGPNLVLAIFSPTRLLVPRNDETAQRYFPVLSRAIKSATHRSGTTRPSAAYAFIYALPR